MAFFTACSMPVRGQQEPLGSLRFNDGLGFDALEPVAPSCAVGEWSCDSHLVKPRAPDH
jgi:hypothetical protein